MREMKKKEHMRMRNDRTTQTSQINANHQSEISSSGGSPEKKKNYDNLYTLLELSGGLP